MSGPNPVPGAYVGEIRIFAGSFAPRGWAFCDGRMLSVAENQALFALLETTYGGDGQTTFALPDLRGRLPIHQGGGFQLGQSGGAETVALTVQQLAGHTHPLFASTALATQETPGSNLTGQTEIALYGNESPFGPMSPQVMTAVGGGQSHANLQPYLCVNFIVSLSGLYPSQT
jgi:microcystin-dependent protein